jgi:hypothetical protein
MPELAGGGRGRSTPPVRAPLYIFNTSQIYIFYLILFPLPAFWNLIAAHSIRKLLGPKFFKGFLWNPRGISHHRWQSFGAEGLFLFVAVKLD